MSSANCSRRPNFSPSDSADRYVTWPTMRATPMPRARRAAGAVVVALLPVRIGHDRVAGDRVPGHALRLQRVRAGDRDDRVDLIRVEHRPLERLHAAERAAGHGGQPRDAELVEQRPLGAHHVGDGDHRKVRTRTAGRSPDSIDDGPVVPRHPPSRLVLTTKKRSVSKALPGPIMPSHQPRPRPPPPSRSSARNPSRVLSPPAARAIAGRVRVAAQRMADQDHVVARRRQRAVGLVGDADRLQDAAAVERHAAGADRGTACRPCRPSPRRPSALAWSCGNHIAWQRRPSCEVERGSRARLSGSAGIRSLSESGRAAGRGRRRAPMYHSQLALIDLSNDQSRSIEGAHDGSVDCQQRRQRRRAARRARGAASAPEAAKFTWRAVCKWKNGTHSQTNVQGFLGLGASRSTRPSSRSRPTIRRSSRPRISASRRSSTCSSAWPAA